MTLVVALVLCAPAPPLTLQAAVQKALQTHARVTVAEINSELAELNVTRFGQQFRPSVAVQGVYDSFNPNTDLFYLNSGQSFPTVTQTYGQAGLTGTLPTGTSYSVSTRYVYDVINNRVFGVVGRAQIGQSLLRGSYWAIDAQRHALESAERAQKAVLKNTREQLVADVAIAYWNAAYLEEVANITATAGELARQQYHLSQLKIRAGLMAPAALAQVQAAIERRQAEELRARFFAQGARANLAQLIGAPQLPPETNLTVSAPEPLTVARGDLLERAKTQNPGFTYLRELQKVAQSEAEAAGYAAMPLLDLGANATSASTATGKNAFADIPTSYNATLTLALPIAGSPQIVEATQKRLVVQQRDAELSQFQRELQVSLELAQGNIELATLNLAARRAQLQHSRQAYQNQRDAFENGRSSAFELLQIQEDLVAAELELPGSVYELRTANLALLRLLGAAEETLASTNL